MHTTNLKKIGGSVLMVVPPVLLKALGLNAGSTVGVELDHGRLLIDPCPKPTYRLEDLLSQCEATAEISTEDREWLDNTPIGGELL
ncbi:MAG: antitoxin [Thermodesulfobacteriota bacterium]|nr:antitoxin [Thermodesulfobacteriota bacterium]